MHGFNNLRMSYAFLKLPYTQGKRSGVVLQQRDSHSPASCQIFEMIQVLWQVSTSGVALFLWTPAQLNSNVPRSPARMQLSVGLWPCPAGEPCPEPAEQVDTPRFKLYKQLNFREESKNANSCLKAQEGTSSTKDWLPDPAIWGLKAFSYYGLGWPYRYIWCCMCVL